MEGQKFVAQPGSNLQLVNTPVLKKQVLQNSLFLPSAVPFSSAVK